MNYSLRLILFISIICSANISISQSYKVTVTNEPFVFLENPELTILDDPEDEWPVFEIPIGFDFDYFDITSDHIYSAGNSFGGYTSLNQDEDDLYMLIHFYANFIESGDSQNTVLSPIYYKTEGSPSNRIFTLEYNHMGFFFGLTDDFGIYLDYINIQVRLHESSGDIEFHIGPYSMQEDPEVVFDGFPGPLVGLMSNVQNYIGGDVGEVILLAGDPQNPVESDNPFSFLDWPIPENSIFRFSKLNSSNSNYVQTKYPSNIYPNPMKDIVTISTDTDFDLIEIYNLEGKKIKQSHSSVIDVSNLATGIYIVKINFKGNIQYHRVSKI